MIVSRYAVSKLFIISLIALLSVNSVLRAHESKQESFNDSLVTCFPEAALMLSRYISIPSISGNENEAAYFLAEQCKQAGLYVQFITDLPGSVNFAASIYPLSDGKPNVILQNHIDVVPAGDTAKWKYPPFEGRIAEGKIWGRGSFDNKGPAIVQLFSIMSIIEESKERDLPYNVTLLCVSGEEIDGSTGAAIVAQNFREMFNPAVVFGEGGSGMRGLSIVPSGKDIFGISIAEKDHLWLKLTWKSEDAGHTSVTGEISPSMMLVNGVHKLINTSMPIIVTPEADLMLKGIGKEVGGIIGTVIKRPNSAIFKNFLKKNARENPELYNIFTNTITLSGISSNIDAHNTNATEVSAYLDCRLLPGTTPSDITNFIATTIHDPEMIISVVSTGREGRTSYPEKYFTKMSDAIKREFKGAAVVPILFPASTDNSYFRRDGVPVYGIIPMIIEKEQLDGIHNHDEYIDLEDIETGIRVFSDFLKKLIAD